MKWYNNGENFSDGQLTMGCLFEKHQAHCFTYNGYEKWQNFETSANDFMNCVGFTSR